jgi:hypothetical protein
MRTVAPPQDPSRGRGFVEWFFVFTAAAHNFARIPKLLASV